MENQAKMPVKRLDAEIQETKSRMARNLLSTHPSFSKDACKEVPVSTGPCYSGSIERNASVEALLLHEKDTTSEPIIEAQASFQGMTFREGLPCAQMETLPCFTKGDMKVDHSTEVGKNTAGRCTNRNLERCGTDGNMKELEDGKCKTNKDNEDHGSSVVFPSRLFPEGSTQYHHLPAEPPVLGPATTDLPIYLPVPIDMPPKHEVPSSVECINQVSLSQCGQRSLNGSARERNHDLVVDMVTDAVMQELLEEELSGLVVHFHTPSWWQQYGTLPMRTWCMDDNGKKWSPHLENANVTSRSYCTESCGETYNETQPSEANGLAGYSGNCDYTMVRNLGYVVGPDEGHICHIQPFKSISKRLVGKYMNDIIEAGGFLNALNLLDVYVSGKSIAWVVQHTTDTSKLEDQTYGKMLFHAVCECLEKHFVRYCLPSFYLSMPPFSAGRQMKEVMVSIVNENADAACEGGFSLEYILQKSLDEEDWRDPFCEMISVVDEVSDEVLMDIIEGLIRELDHKEHLLLCDYLPASPALLHAI